MLENYLTHIVNHVPEIPESKKYWLVRTNSGKFFNFYFYNEIVCLGYNEIKVKDLMEDKQTYKSEKSIREIITSVYKKLKKRKINRAFQQINAFVNHMKDKDWVLIPNYASHSLMIGEVVGNNIEEQYHKNENGEIICENVKYRKVKWLKMIERSSLSSELYGMFFSHHALLNLSTHAVELESKCNDLFKYKDKYHYFIRVDKNGDISAMDLIDYIAGLLKTNDKLHDNNVDYLIKTKIKSPGYLEIIHSLPHIAITLWILNHALVGGKFNLEIFRALKLKSETKGLLAAISEIIERKGLFKFIDTTARTSLSLKIRESKQLQEIIEEKVLEQPKQD